MAAHDGYRKCVSCDCAKFVSRSEGLKRSAARARVKSKHYDSGLERRIGIDLEFQKDAGRVLEIDRQYRIEIWISGIKICTHYVDYRVLYEDGSVELIEGKGKQFGEWTMKRNLVEAVYLPANPGTTYRVLK